MIPPIPHLTGEENLPDELPLPPGFRGWLVWLFRVPSQPHPRRRRDVIVWWERRRLAYNLVVGTIGLISYLIFLYLTARYDYNHLQPGPSLRITFLIPVFIVIGMNICYTTGWIAELGLSLIRVRGRLIGPILFRIGLIGSTMYVWLPVAWMGVVNLPGFQ